MHRDDLLNRLATLTLHSRRDLRAQICGSASAGPFRRVLGRADVRRRWCVFGHNKRPLMGYENADQYDSQRMPDMTARHAFH